MSPGTTLPLDALRALESRLEFYRELGLYDFYQRPLVLNASVAASAPVLDESENRISDTTPISSGTPAKDSARVPCGDQTQKELEIARRPAAIASDVFPLASLGPVLPAAERPGAMLAIRDLIGDCTRCRLSEARNKIVFGDGDPNARLMFVGEGPGADEDMQGIPFVGRAGQLLSNMIGAMGLARPQVYIANIVKCRPPQNRKPEPDEAHTCTPFLERQIDVIQPQVLVALGATAATYLLGMKGAIAGMRGRIHDYRGIQTIVTYHPAYLLRDPSQKKEAWKDLQMAMTALGLKPPSRAPQA